MVSLEIVAVSKNNAYLCIAFAEIAQSIEH